MRLAFLYRNTCSGSKAAGKFDPVDAGVAILLVVDLTVAPQQGQVFFRADEDQPRGRPSLSPNIPSVCEISTQSPSWGEQPQEHRLAGVDLGLAGDFATEFGLMHLRRPAVKALGPPRDAPVVVQMVQRSGADLSPSCSMDGGR